MIFFLNNFRRGFISKKFFLCILIAIICILIGVFMNINNIKYLGGLSLFFAGSSFRGVSPITFLAVIICTLPFSDKVVEDYETKLNIYVNLRMNRINYILTMLITNGIIGFLSLFLPYMFLLIINIIFWGHSNIDTGSPPIILNNIFLNNQLLYSFLLVIWYSLFGIVYSTFGFACSILTRKKFSSVVIPFIYYLGGGLLCSILGLSKFEPVGTFDLNYQKDTTFLNVSTHLLIIFLVSLSLIYFYTKRKYENYI